MFTFWCRVNLHALQSQLNRSINFAFHVFEILVHGIEADKVLVLAALLGDEVVDDGHLARRCVHGMHEVVSDGRALAGRGIEAAGSVLGVHVTP